MKNRTVHLGLALAVALIASLAVAQTVPASTKLDEKAKDAVLALKKLQSRAEIGADYHDYSSALADAYFSVKMFLESEQTETVPEFSNALRKSITWYKTAGDVWKAMQSSSGETGIAERGGFFLCDYDNGVALCKSHPELVVWNTTKDGRRYSSIIYQPLKTSLEYAGEELEKADKQLRSQNQ